MAKKKVKAKSKKPTSKELVPSNTGAFAVSDNVKFDQSLPGASANIDNADIDMSKILLMADMSELVKKQKIATPGEFRDKTTGELIGDEAGFDCFVIGSVKLWQIFGPEKDKKGQLVYNETIDFIGNEDLEYSQRDDRDNEVLHRDVVLRFFVILLDELANGMAFPLAIDFKRTSRQAGKDLSKYFFKMRQKGIPSYGMVFHVSSEEQTSSDGFEYWVKKVNLGRAITQKELTDVQEFSRGVVKAQAENRLNVNDDDEKSETIEVKGKTVSSKSKF